MTVDQGDINVSKPNDYDTYIIPPNFIEGGTFFGGLLKLRNTAGSRQDLCAKLFAGSG